VKIQLENIGKRFNREWIFRNISYTFSGNNKYSLLGTNGTGKSTLLQIIAGSMSQTEGKIIYDLPSIKKESESGLFSQVAFAAPYLELPEEMNWREAIVFHGRFKKFTNHLSADEIIKLSQLELAAGKEIRNFSSGMKQRAKLTLAILSDTPLLFLDEPSTNLDEKGVRWYQNLISEFAKEKMVLVCSNYNKEEYSFCNESLIISN